MSKRYFIVGTLWGLSVAALISYWILGVAFLDLLSNRGINGAIPIAVGAAAALGVAAYSDRRAFPQKWCLQAIALPSVIFLVGSLTGTLANALINGLPGGDLFDYLIKPLYWIWIIGIPSSALVGLLYFAGYKALSRNV